MYGTIGGSAWQRPVVSQVMRRYIFQMVFDLGAALLKKQEFESARMAEFEFYRRVRTARLLAARFNLDERWLVSESVNTDEAGLVALVAGRADIDSMAVESAYRQSVADAHAQLVLEKGDPTPHRMA